MKMPCERRAVQYSNGFSFISGKGESWQVPPENMLFDKLIKFNMSSYDASESVHKDSLQDWKGNLIVNHGIACLLLFQLRREIISVI